MRWEVNRGSNIMCTFEVLTTVDGVLEDNTTILNETVSKDTVIGLAKDICDAIQDECGEAIEFLLGFRKYGLMQLKMTFKDDFNWTQDDWEYFKFDLAMALIVLVRQYRMQCYRNSVVLKEVWHTLQEMEQFVLSESGDPDAHKAVCYMHESQVMEVAEKGRV